MSKGGFTVVDMPEKTKLKVIISQKTFDYVHPIVVISRVVGLSPVKFEKTGGDYVVSISYIYVAYSYIFGLILGELFISIFI